MAVSRTGWMKHSYLYVVGVVTIGTIAVLITQFGRVQGWSLDATSLTHHQETVRSQGQPQVAAENGTGASPMHVSTDGAISPHLIADALAYRHFISTTLVHQAPSEDDRKRYGLRIARIGFGGADAIVYSTEMTRLASVLGALATHREALGNPPFSAEALLAAKELNKQEVQVYKDARERLRSNLSPEGFRRLDWHIQTHVKQRIRTVSPNTQQ